MSHVLGRRASKEVPASAQQQQHRSSIESLDDERDEELARQQRIYIESSAGYLRASRARSTELHGVVYLSEPEVAPAETTQTSSTMQHTEQHHSGSSAGSAEDAGVMVRDLEGGKAGQQTDKDSKVLQLLEPIGGPGQEKLVLGFERLSVWAPVNPKKPSIFERGWKKAVSCGKTETNPQRQILFDVSGQVSILVGYAAAAAAASLQTV